MGLSPSFSSIFSKRDHFCKFLFLYLEDKIFPKKGLLLKERIRSDERANSFLYEMTSICTGGNNGNDRVASPESVSIHLKNQILRNKPV